jgi:hypothetical protein
MDTQDIIKISHRAKTETEAFINRHINDTAKGWPKNCFCGSNYAGYSQEQHVGRREKTGILVSQ